MPACGGGTKASVSLGRSGVPAMDPREQSSNARSFLRPPREWTVTSECARGELRHAPGLRICDYCVQYGPWLLKTASATSSNSYIGYGWRDSASVCCEVWAICPLGPIGINRDITLTCIRNHGNASRSWSHDCDAIRP